MPAFSRIECRRGDLTRERADAIVNAASPALRGGGGVDGAIHRAAGPELLAELIARYPKGCAVGEACPTGAHGLNARMIIHTPGPIWRGGGAGEAEALAACHRSSIVAAGKAGCRSIAFPAISCGVYGYPPDRAAPLAVRAVGEALEDWPELQARFVLFSEPLRELFQAALDQARGA